MVVVPDFGNGFISQRMVEVLCRKARFLAVNTQLNSGNRGHHVISRYSRADFASINEPELRLAAHNRHDPIELVAETIGQKINSSHIAITCGSKGVMFKDRKSGAIHYVPALSTKVLDRVGAGDAFLALASLCIGGGRPRRSRHTSAVSRRRLTYKSSATAIRSDRWTCLNTSRRCLNNGRRWYASHEVVDRHID